MKAGLFITYILSTFLTTVKAQDRNNIDTLNTIEWTEKRRLTYGDFQGTQDTTFLVYGYPTPGATMTKVRMQLSYDENDRLIAQVTNTFSKMGSWLTIKDSSILNHEQGHFDISEISAAKLRIEIKALVDKGLQDETTLRQLFEKFLNQRDKLQADYDSETHHGFNASQQIIWDKRIKTELAKLRFHLQ